jgi:hypothetical protein
MYNFWKWSSGETETYYRSPRITTSATAYETNGNQGQGQDYDTRVNAINQSLADYNQNQNQNQDSDLINITNTMFSRNQNLNGTRREDIDCKMADREMLSQRGVNPFLQTSYVNDIVTRDMFLKPINTTQGRVKQEDKSIEA